MTIITADVRNIKQRISIKKKALDDLVWKSHLAKVLNKMPTSSNDEFLLNFKIPLEDNYDWARNIYNGLVSKNLMSYPEDKRCLEDLTKAVNDVRFCLAYHYSLDKPEYHNLNDGRGKMKCFWFIVDNDRYTTGMANEVSIMDKKTFCFKHNLLGIVDFSKNLGIDLNTETTGFSLGFRFPKADYNFYREHYDFLNEMMDDQEQMPVVEEDNLTYELYYDTERVRRIRNIIGL